MNESSTVSKKTSILFNPVTHTLLIVALGLLVYSNTFNVPFQFDDNSNIIENYTIRDLSNFWPPTGSRWFGYLTFAINYRLGGLNTTGYHILNLAVHIINSLLVYWLVILTFKTPFLKGYNSSFMDHGNCELSVMSYAPSTLISLFSALLFVSHPAQTQAVTYIWQRLASLATMFYLLTLVLYIEWKFAMSEQLAVSPLSPSLPLPGEAQGQGWGLRAKRYALYAASFVSAVLSMKVKEISFTLPFIIVLYEFSFFGKSQTSGVEPFSIRRFFYLLPFLFTLIIIPLSLVGPDLGLYEPQRDEEILRQSQLQGVTTHSRHEYLLTQFRVVVTYIRLIFLPINQNLDYDYPIYNSFLNPHVLLSFLFLLAMFGLAVYFFYASRVTRRALRLFAFGIFWFFITLSVESSVIPIRDVIYEHRLYLPLVGASVIFSSTIFYSLNYWKIRNKLIVICMLLITIIPLGIATYKRNLIWEDEITLWEDVTKKSPHKSQPHNNLGVIYATQNKHNDAIREFSIALSLKPDNVETHNNIGNIYASLGFVDKAIAYYQAALELRPNFADAHNNIGYAYCDKGWLDKAIEHYQIALKLNPDYAEAYNNLGAVYEKKGLLDEAARQYQTALRLNPNDKITRNNLDRILRTKN